MHRVGQLGKQSEGEVKPDSVSGGGVGGGGAGVYIQRICHSVVLK